MQQNQIARVAYRLLFALLGFSAIVTEIAVLADRGRFDPVNFFSYFTIEGNILVVLALLLSTITVARGSRKFDSLRAAVTVYILVVGVGFSVLLAGLENTEFTAVPWDNFVLHYLMPVAMLVDLLLDRPRQRLSFVRSLWWLLFPIGYAVYSLVRGAIVGWYPYPFLNPDHQGYGAVTVAVIGISLLSVGLTWLIVRLSGALPQPKK